MINSVGRLAPNHEVVLSSQVSGIVQAYRVGTGDAVTANQMLVLLDPTDYQLALNEARANLHSARARYAAAKNSFLRAGERIGHPSCEGGISSGTHMHLARRYNGEWISADQDVPFVLDGWTTMGLGYEYDGLLQKNGQTVEAWDGRDSINEIQR